MRRRVHALLSLLLALPAVALLGGSPAAAATPATTGLQGVDVSRWQHDGTPAAIDWGKVRAAGKRFAIIQATRGRTAPLSSDGTYWFPIDWAGARAAGLVVGAYSYAMPRIAPHETLVDTAILDARYFVSKTGSLRAKGVLPAVLDYENNDAGLSPAQLVAFAGAWLGEVQRLTGRRPLIYSYPHFWRTQMADTTAFSSRGYRLWVASYTTTPELFGGWTTYTFWQYGIAGETQAYKDVQVPGITGSVDLDRYCCDTMNLVALSDGTTVSPLIGTPFGAFERTERRPGGLGAVGWAVDPDTTAPLRMHFYVDGRPVLGMTADVPRSLVSGLYPGFGSDHGFDTTVPVPPGRHTVCAFAIDVGPGLNRLLGCRTATLYSNPIGHYDSATRTGNDVQLTGWALDPDSAGPVRVHVYVDGAPTLAATADTSRPDIGRIYPAYGDAHGFDVQLTVAPGAHRVCIFAINIGAGTNTLLGCRSV